MKKWFTILIMFILIISITGCSKGNDKTVLDVIRSSPAATMELPDGSSVYVDSEINSIRSFADLELMMAPLEPADDENDWLYRIVFNPDDKITNINEVIVSFHEKYVQINSEYYLTPRGVDYDSILQWADSKFAYFIN